MRERSIIFSGPMVRAILDGTKTQTRRVMKHQIQHVVVPGIGPMLAIQKPKSKDRWLWPNARQEVIDACPYGRPGDRLWVRETWSDCTKGACAMGGTKYETPWYRADADAYGLLGHDGIGPVYTEELKWRPSIHMPRWASRITLEITDVRVERVQDISEDDAIAEGITGNAGGAWGREGLIEDFADLWGSINAARGHGWDANPWVWVVEFRRVRAVVED